MAAHFDGGRIMWWRIALGMTAGVLTGVVLGFALETAGHLVFPPPEGTDISDPAQLATIIDVMPLGAKIWLAGGWAIASFIAGAIAVWIGRAQIAAFGVAGILLGLGIMTMIQIPHPAWLAAAYGLALFVPAVLGGYLVSRRTPMATAPA
jgi:hypothetical protein